MSASSLRTISGFIKTKGKHHLILTDELVPDVLIIDIDNPKGQQLLSHYQNSGINLITLSLSQQENIPASIIQIRKPLTGVEILRSAEKIQNSLVSKKKIHAGEPKKVVDHKRLPSEPLPQQPLAYDPSTTFQGMLRKAIQLSDTEKTPVLISIQQYRIEIHADKNRARLNFSTKRLRTLCQFPLTDHLCNIRKGLMVSTTNDNSVISLPELSWDVALFCSRGRLPQNIAADAQYALNTWPNLTRWNHCEHAMRIASLWSKSPNNINNIALQLALPVENICSFITAAIDSNLANKCDDMTEVLPFKSKKSNSDLFRKLLKRLKRA